MTARRKKAFFSMDLYTKGEYVVIFAWLTLCFHYVYYRCALYRRACLLYIHNIYIYIYFNLFNNIDQISNNSAKLPPNRKSVPISLQTLSSVHKTPWEISYNIYLHILQIICEYICYTQNPHAQMHTNIRWNIEIYIVQYNTSKSKYQYAYTAYIHYTKHLP